MELMALDVQLPTLGSFPFEVQDCRSGVPWQWPSRALIIAPSFQLSNDKTEPRRGSIDGSGLFYQLKAERSLKFSTKGYRVQLIHPPTQFGNPWLSSHLAWPLSTAGSPLPPPILDDSNYDKLFLALIPNPLSNNFHPKILLSLAFLMSFLNLLIFTSSKQVLDPQKVCTAKICWQQLGFMVSYKTQA